MDWTLIFYLCYSQRHVSEPQITAVSSYKPCSPGHVCVCIQPRIFSQSIPVLDIWLYSVALRDLKGRTAFVWSNACKFCSWDETGIDGTVNSINIIVALGWLSSVTWTEWSGMEFPLLKNKRMSVCFSIYSILFRIHSGFCWFQHITFTICK